MILMQRHYRPGIWGALPLLTTTCSSGQIVPSVLLKTKKKPRVVKLSAQSTATHQPPGERSLSLPDESSRSLLPPRTFNPRGHQSGSTSYPCVAREDWEGRKSSCWANRGQGCCSPHKRKRLLPHRSGPLLLSAHQPASSLPAARALGVLIRSVCVPWTGKPVPASTSLVSASQKGPLAHAKPVASSSTSAYSV